MRISIELTPYRWSQPESAQETIQRTINLAKQADIAGYYSVWISEDPDSWDATAMLGAIAMQTNRILLTSGVVNPIFRHPAQLAAASSTLDRLSGGRFRLGLGRGQTEWLGDSLGMAIDHPLQRLEEAIDLLHQWWTPPFRASSEGPIGIDNWTRSFGPLSERLPLFLAAAGPKAVELTGKKTDGLLFNELTSPDAMKLIIAQASAAAVSAGRDPRELQFIARPGIVVTDHPDTVRNMMKRRIAMIHSLPGMAHLIQLSDFDVHTIMEHVRSALLGNAEKTPGKGFADIRQQADWDAVFELIPDEMVDRLAIIGPLEYVQQRVGQLRELGISEIVLLRGDLNQSSAWELLPRTLQG